MRTRRMGVAVVVGLGVGAAGVGIMRSWVAGAEKKPASSSSSSMSSLAPTPPNDADKRARRRRWTRPEWTEALTATWETDAEVASAAAKIRARAGAGRIVWERADPAMVLVRGPGAWHAAGLATEWERNREDPPRLVRAVETPLSPADALDLLTWVGALAADEDNVEDKQEQKLSRPLVWMHDTRRVVLDMDDDEAIVVRTLSRHADVVVTAEPGVAFALETVLNLCVGPEQTVETVVASIPTSESDLKQRFALATGREPSVEELKVMRLVSTDPETIVSKVSGRTTADVIATCAGELEDAIRSLQADGHENVAAWVWATFAALAHGAHSDGPRFMGSLNRGQGQGQGDGSGDVPRVAVLVPSLLVLPEAALNVALDAFVVELRVDAATEPPQFIPALTAVRPAWRLAYAQLAASSLLAEDMERLSNQLWAQAELKLARQGLEASLVALEEAQADVETAPDDATKLEALLRKNRAQLDMEVWRKRVELLHERVREASTVSGVEGCEGGK